MKTVLIAFACCATCAFGQKDGSLWNDSQGVPFRDTKAAKVGDVLTILITENSSATSKAETKTAKDESMSTTAGLGPILKRLLPEWGASGKEASNATGSTSRSGSLSAKMSVVIKRVLPNGSMEIEGKRDVMVNKEVQKLVLTGIVRPYDIGPDNTVPSYLIANADIRYEGKGPIGDKQSDGLIMRAFKWLFGGLIK
jgi:flagellar L-ring protein precursor FlgH